MKKIHLLIVVFILITCLSKAEKKDLKIGLTLSGGGAKGLAHIGVLKVLEEYDIRPDYITGTSMGSIVGALYSIGYNAEELENIVKSQDWESILFDVLPRTSVSMEEKDVDAKFAVTFPMDGLKIKLPSGMVSGQNVTQLLTRLTYGYHNVNDFNNLPIPFKCIATDIENGEAVILDKGYLPEAIRASMSIPSMFTPVELDSLLLVDGGLVRNFPVSDCKEMGADFVIGIDVGTGLHNKENLKSIIQIMEQSIGLYGAENNRIERNKTDLLIIPPVKDFSITDFERADSLIAIGERAARLKIEEIKILSKRLGLKPPVEKYCPSKRIKIVDIKYNGLNKVSKNLIIGKMPLREGRTYTLERIDRAITQLYGTRYFQSINYKLYEEDNGFILFIDVNEKRLNLFRAGFHYDSDMNASILLNTTFRNVVVEGSKVTIDFELGENKTFHYSEFIHTGLRPGFGFKIDLLYDEFDYTFRNPEGVKQAQFGIEDSSIIFFFDTIFSDNFLVGTSLQFLRNELIGEIIPVEWGNLDDTNWWMRSAVYAKIDKRNKSHYPTKGLYAYCEYKWFNCLSDIEYYDKYFARFYFSAEKIFPINKSVAFAVGGFAGSTNSTQLQGQDTFYLGGYVDKDNGRPFTGYFFGEVLAEETYILRGRVQVEPWRNIFLIARWDSGRVIRDLLEFGADDFWTHGYGISFAYKTPIGPIEYTIMANDRDDDTRSYINIGYNF